LPIIQEVKNYDEVFGEAYLARSSFGEKRWLSPCVHRLVPLTMIFFIVY